MNNEYIMVTNDSKATVSVLYCIIRNAIKVYNNWRY